MNSKNSKKKKSKNSLKKNSIRKSNCQKPKVSQNRRKGNYHKKIADERKPFIFERVMAGVPGTVIAEEFGEVYEPIDQSSLNQFLRERPEEYKAWRDLNFKDDVRLADRKARILALQRKVDLLGRKIDEILKEISTRQFGEASLALLLREYREYVAQIQDESGDKVHKIKADGITGDLVFGDKVVNAFADKTVEARVKETTDPRNRFKKAGLSDFGNSISGN